MASASRSRSLDPRRGPGRSGALGTAVGRGGASACRDRHPGSVRRRAQLAVLLGPVSLFLAVFFLGPLAIIFGALGLKRCNSGEATNRAMALSGVILGGIATILYLLIIAAAIASSGSGY